jgi:CMP/dCMP kinase
MMIVTIDGPAGAGKSSVAKRLADRLGYDFLDTGAMYRVVALAGLRRGIDWADAEAVAQLARSVDIRFDDPRILLNGEDVSAAIRANETTVAVRHVADHPEVRQHLVSLQRQFAVGRNLVTEGRDQGTLVFPDAACKLFLNASAQERARRRVADLRARGQEVPFEEVLRQQQRRDDEDRQRPLGGLTMAADAIEFDTDGMSLDHVVQRLEQIVRRRVEQVAGEFTADSTDKQS